MIIGHGDIASVLPDRQDLLFFASGVSNSQEERREEYQRETDLLIGQDRDQQIVYFSSLAVFYSDTRYTRHKRAKEIFITNAFPIHTIIRIGNITWGNNPNTIINFLKNKIKNKEPYEVRDEYRYIVTKDEFLHWIDLIPTHWSCEMNIPGKMMKIQDIVEAIKDGRFG